MTQVKNRKKKILVPVKYPVGGIRTYIKYTFGNLDRDKYSYTFLSPEPEWNELIRQDLKGFELDFVLPQGKKDALAILKSIFRTLSKERYDIIHSQGYTAGILACIANLVFRVPHVITLHHIFTKDEGIENFWNQHEWVKRFLLERVLVTADMIQSVSHDAQGNLLEYFPRLGKKPEKLMVILNGIDMSEFPEYSRDTVDVPNRGNPWADKRFVIGFLGRYLPQKGFPFLLDCVEYLVKERKIDDFIIVTVGGFGGFIREYKKDMRNRGLEDYFYFHDFEKNVRNVLLKFDMLLVPSVWEACPLVPMEALICGIPIIAFSCIGLREVLEGTPAIMVDKGDVKGLSKAIVHVMKNLSKIKKEFNDYEMTARERYDVQRTSEKLEELYKKLTN